jgi:hypothetical protein
MQKDPAEVAKYISERLAELGREARGVHLDTLGYFIEAARREAKEVIRVMGRQ